MKLQFLSRLAAKANGARRQLAQMLLLGAGGFCFLLAITLGSNGGAIAALLAPLSFLLGTKYARSVYPADPISGPANVGEVDTATDTPTQLVEQFRGDRIAFDAASDDVERLRRLAKEDSLTGLSNRTHFEAIVRQHMANADEGAPHCFVFIDLDEFKQINDVLGHSQGDRLLVACADRLRLATNLDASEITGNGRAKIEVARFGGDEFVIFVGSAGSENTAKRLSKRILRVFSDPFHLGARAVQVGASLGVAFAPEHGTDFAELLRKADAAMYQAKRLGSNRYEFYSSALLENARQAEEEEKEVREAFARGEFELHFQPLFDARTKEISSAEGLLRWRHPRRGLLLPGAFFDAIDRSNLSGQVGEWVINEATRRVAELERAGTPLMIAANVSPTHIENIEFPSLVRACINRWRCTPNLLQLEITEDAAMRDPAMTARSLGKLNDVGVSIAIDDFGTGYSNLAKLIMLPISRLKIDRSMLQRIEDRPEAFVLVQTIINLSNSLGFHSVAEGVESEEQQRILQSMGCDVLQGFLFSKAIPFEKLKLLAQHHHQAAGPTAVQTADLDLAVGAEPARSKKSSKKPPQATIAA